MRTPTLAWLIIPALVLSGRASATDAPRLPLAEIVRQMDERDQARGDGLVSCTCERRYALENHRFRKQAEIRVRMTYSYPGHKELEIVSERGSSVLCPRSASIPGTTKSLAPFRDCAGLR